MKGSRSLGIYLFGALALIVGIGACGGGDSDTATTTVSGTVLDFNGDPVPDALVTIQSDPVETHTDTTGFFTAVVEVGGHSITVTVDGEIIFEGEITAEKGSPLDLGELDLTEPYSLDGIFRIDVSSYASTDSGPWEFVDSPSLMDTEIWVNGGIVSWATTEDAYGMADPDGAQYWLTDMSEALYWIGGWDAGDNEEFFWENPIILLMSEFEVDTWVDLGLILYGGTGQVRWTFEDVTVPAGSFENCICAQVQVIGTGTTNLYYYFSKNVGRVQVEYSDGAVEVLNDWGP